MLGSCGAGMSALGEVLMDRGHQLIGFDQSVLAPAFSTQPTAHAPEASSQRGSISTSHWEWDSQRTADTVVCICSPAISEDDDLRRRFTRAAIPIIALHEALDVIFKECHQICVAGTHGKSTTTAMLAWIMEQVGADSSYFIGAKFQHNRRSGKSQSLAPIRSWNQTRRQHSAILESCEFNRSFHWLSPSTIVLTGLERDHFDCFRDQQAEDEAFLQFLHKLPGDGSIIYNVDCPRSVRLVRQIDNRSFACSMQSDSDSQRNTDFHVTEFEQRPLGIQFQLQFRSETVLAKLPAFGRHNAANAVTAIAAAASQGFSISDAVDALASFPGIERRFQYRGSFRGMELIDDYAHHPTAVRTTLQAARKKFPNREIRVCFEPHQLIRLAQLENEFVDALSLADTVYVLPVLAARESASTAKCHQDSQKLIIRLRSRGTSAFFSPNLDHVVRTVDHSANLNAVLLTMGAGSTHLIHDKLTDRLRRYSVA